jgi:Fe-S-cluster containining protein
VGSVVALANGQPDAAAWRGPEPVLRSARVSAREPPWKTSATRAELLALYAQADALLAPFSCEASTDCCRFGVTGREPYVTPPELAELQHAIAGRGGALPVASPPRPGRSLPTVTDERRCPLLDPNGRCSVYASRPLGCRTFFCDRVQGPSRLPRTQLNAIARSVADLAARFAPRDPHSRPLSRAVPRR